MIIIRNNVALAQRTGCEAKENIGGTQRKKIDQLKSGSRAVTVVKNHIISDESFRSLPFYFFAKHKILDNLTISYEQNNLLLSRRDN